MSYLPFRLTDLAWKFRYQIGPGVFVQSSETDTSQAVTHLKRKTLGQSSLTNTAQVITHRKTQTLGQPSETELAQTIPPIKSSTGIHSVNVVTQTNTAQAITRHKTKEISQITLTNTAQAITRRKKRTLGQVTQTNTAQPIIAIASDWALIFDDTFPTNVSLGNFPAAVSSKWTAYPNNYHDTSGNGNYDPQATISITSGVMNIHLYTTTGGVHKVAAPVAKIHPLGVGELWPGQLYGRYQITARIPVAIPGYKIAWLLWPDVGTNTTGASPGPGGNGEIDYPEANLVSPMNSVGMFVHHQNATVGNDQYGNTVSCNMTQWQTYTIEWSPNLCRFLLNGTVVGQETVRVPNSSMHWVIQCETRLSGGAPSSTVSGDIQIDRVTVWSYSP